MSEKPLELLDGSAWRDFCRRLESIGETIRGDAFPSDPRGRAEGYRALTRWLVYALQQEVEAGDPLFPGFVRHQDPWNQWGGPNPDNVYLRANIDPTKTYRVWSEDTRGLRQAIFSLHEGDMHLDEYGVFGEQSFSDFETGPNGEFELWLTPDSNPAIEGNCIGLHPDARIFTIRQYIADWQRDAAPKFHIACEETVGKPRGPVDPGQVASGLERAVRWVEASAEYWNRYTSRAWSRAAPNEAGPAQSAQGGADNILYGNCFWQLLPDEVLLLSVEQPEAEYWSFVSHTMHWLESGEWDRRTTSLNDQQLFVDPDGVVRLVVAHEDPGVPNWIDTEGRARGMLVYRWVWSRNNPQPEARLLRGSQLAEVLPASHPQVSPEERRRQLAARSEAAWGRFR